MPALASRITALEANISENPVIFVSWLREPSKEISKVTSGDVTWLRDASESEQEFLKRVRKDIRPSGPHPQFGFVQ
jgi:hypothetical protein